MIRLLPLLGVVALLGAGCSGDVPDDGRVSVQASFHPLAHVVERVGGDRVEVVDLTRPGVEAHDLELRPSDIGAMIDADLVVYLGGFQPAVDEAVDEVGDHALDVGPFVGVEPGTADPHFWLDPDLLGDVAVAVRDRLIEIDPDHADAYRRDAERLLRRLHELTGSFERGLARCESREIVVTHEAFGFLADRFGLEQVPITGLNPVEDPTGRQLAEAVRLVRERDVSTVFLEPLMSPRIARTVASEAGVDTAVLDPIEGIADPSSGLTYPDLMEQNLEVLRKGLRCR